MSEANRKLAYALVAGAIDAHWASMVISTVRDEVLAEVAKIRDGMRAASEVPLSPTGAAEMEHPFDAPAPGVGDFCAVCEQPRSRHPAEASAGSRCDECGAALDDQDVCTADRAHRQDGGGYLFSDKTDPFSRLMASALADLRHGVGPDGVVDADQVERRFQEMIASGRLSEAGLRAAFDQRFPPKAAPGPLVTGTDDEEGEGPFVENHCPECGEYESECTCEEDDAAEARAEVRPEASRLEQEEAGRGPPPPPAGQGPAAVEGLPPASVRTDAGATCAEVVAWLNADRSGAEGARLRAYRDHLHDCASCDEVADLRALAERARTS